MLRPSIIRALVTRQVLLYTRNPIRGIELFFWPIVQLLVWGFVTVFLQQQSESSNFGNFITFLIGAIILWDALFRSQQGVAISFLEDVWTRNLLNVFAAPIRMSEYLVATFVVGVLRVLVTAMVLAAIAAVVYTFDLFQFGGALYLFYANLMMFGWILGIFSTALILRWGHAAESLAWAVPFIIQPFACVFYEVEVLPKWMQAVALSLPPVHIFEGMREILRGQALDPIKVATAFGLNLLFFTVASATFILMLNVARKRGLLVKTASS